MELLAVLPGIALVLLIGTVYRPRCDWRSAILGGALLWGVLVTAMTEGLSAIGQLTTGAVVGLWLLVCGGLGWLAWRRGLPAVVLPDWDWRLWLRERPGFLGLLLWMGTIATLVGVVAIVAAPNNWDSMTYHMSRVMHWIQNRNVAHYPTYNLPQLFHPPFAEFAILHLQLLSGGDRYANLIQWFAMLGSLVGTSLIAQQLGADWRGQNLAAIFTASLPMGILQASSTQNDYVVCFWMVCVAHYSLKAVQEKLDLLTAAQLGSSLGLAILTKGSAYVYTLPWMVWLFAAKLLSMRLKLWQPMVVVGGIALTLNANHYWRNFTLFGTPLGTPADFAREYKIEIYSLSALVSNILRNLSLHADIVRHLGLQKVIPPTTGITQTLLQIIHNRILHLDLNDPRTTWPVGSFQVPGVSLDENVAGNPLQMYVVLVAIALCLLYGQLRRQHLLVSYGLTITVAFLLLCLLLKIQPYQSRHHLTFLVLFAPFVGTVFCQTVHRRVVVVLAAVLLLTATPWVLQNKFRPIVAEQTIFNTSRTSQLFNNRRFLEHPYRETVAFVSAELRDRQCRDVGLWLGTGESVGNPYWEYPFWVLFKATNLSVRLEHLNVKNASAQKSEQPPFDQFRPCLVISVKRDKDEILHSQELVIREQRYRPIWQSLPVSVLETAGS